MASISHRIGSARSTIRFASSILHPSSFSLVVKRLAVHLDVAVQRHLLGDEALGKAAGLGVADEVGEPVRGLAAVELEIGGHVLPAIEYRALQYRAAEMLAE